MSNTNKEPQVYEKASRPAPTRYRTLASFTWWFDRVGVVMLVFAALQPFLALLLSALRRRPPDEAMRLFAESWPSSVRWALAGLGLWFVAALTRAIVDLADNSHRQFDELAALRKRLDAQGAAEQAPVEAVEANAAPEKTNS
jgi:hypothetical protein